MIQGCKKINRKIFIPSHQKNRSSLVVIPIKIYQATNEVNENATVIA